MRIDILTILPKLLESPFSISIMQRALNEIIIEGIDTNINLHKWILKQDIFTTGQYNTNWLEKNISNFQ